MRPSLAHLFVALVATSCGLWTDLEDEHPYSVSVQTTPPNQTTTNNGATNGSTATNNDTTNVQQPTNGDPQPCDDAGNVPNPMVDCTPPNPDPGLSFLLQDFALVVLDESLGNNQQCADGGDGADLQGLQVEVQDELVALQIVDFAPGPGGFPDAATAQILLDASTDPNQNGCDNVVTVPLGCGGRLAVGFLPNDANTVVSVDDVVTVRIYETDPQCDGGIDAYSVYLCPIQAVDPASGTCFLVQSGVQGNLELSARPSDFLP